MHIFNNIYFVSILWAVFYDVGSGGDDDDGDDNSVSVDVKMSLLFKMLAIIPLDVPEMLWKKGGSLEKACTISLPSCEVVSSAVEPVSHTYPKVPSLMTQSGPNGWPHATGLL